MVWSLHDEIDALVSERDRLNEVLASAGRIADEARRELEWLERLETRRNLEVRERLKWIRRYLRLYELAAGPKAGGDD